LGFYKVHIRVDLIWQYVQRMS